MFYISSILSFFLRFLGGDFLKSKRPRKFKITIRQIVVIVLCILMVLPALMLPVMGLEDNQTVTIVLDPGHGGSVEQNKIKNQAVGAENR